MADAELFVLDEGWGEAVIRETTEFELESERGFDVTNSALFLPCSAHFSESKAHHRVGRDDARDLRTPTFARFPRSASIVLAFLSCLPSVDAPPGPNSLSLQYV